MSKKITIDLSTSDYAKTLIAAEKSKYNLHDYVYSKLFEEKDQLISSSEIITLQLEKEKTEKELHNANTQLLQLNLELFSLREQLSNVNTNRGQTPAENNDAFPGVEDIVRELADKQNESDIMQTQLQNAIANLDEVNAELLSLKSELETAKKAVKKTQVTLMETKIKLQEKEERLRTVLIGFKAHMEFVVNAYTDAEEGGTIRISTKQHNNDCRSLKQVNEEIMELEMSIHRSEKVSMEDLLEFKLGGLLDAPFEEPNN